MVRDFTLYHRVLEARDMNVSDRSTYYKRVEDNLVQYIIRINTESEIDQLATGDALNIVGLGFRNVNPDEWEYENLQRNVLKATGFRVDKVSNGWDIRLGHPENINGGI